MIGYVAKSASSRPCWSNSKSIYMEVHPKKLGPWDTAYVDCSWSLNRYGLIRYVYLLISDP